MRELRLTASPKRWVFFSATAAVLPTRSMSAVAIVRDRFNKCEYGHKQGNQRNNKRFPTITFLLKFIMDGEVPFFVLH